MRACTTCTQWREILEAVGGNPAWDGHPYGCLAQPGLGELGTPGQAGCTEVVQQGPSATGCFPGVVETLEATMDIAANVGAAGAGQAAGSGGGVGPTIILGHTHGYIHRYNHWVTGWTVSSPPSGTSSPQPCPTGIPLTGLPR